MKANIKYMLKNWIAWDKKSLIYFFIRVPALVFQPIVTAYIPKAMIDCITEGVTVQRLITIIGLLSLLLTLTIWIDPFMQELIRGGARIVRMRYAVAAFQKNLKTDYVNIENLEQREIQKRAEAFYNGRWSGGANFIDRLNQFCVAITGVITSSVLIIKINGFIILLIVATCALQFFVLKKLSDKQYKNLNAASKQSKKFDYFYHLAKDGRAAKDIKLYGFSESFIKALAKFLYEIEKIYTKYTHQAVAFDGITALLNLIREVIAYAYLVYLVTADSGKNFSAEEINSVEFKNVSFTYPAAEEPTLKSINLKFAAGEKIAVVGKNGAGKTTLIKLLCGLYSPSSGKILINGTNTAAVSKSSCFDLFATIFQDYYFLPMTIQQNITAGTEYDRKRLFDAFEKAGIADKINSLPDREHSLMCKEVYKNAVDFSGGEKQKLLLAKAIYKNAPILILDEPTAALDPIAENELYLKYNELTRGKLSFFISHRLSSTRFCDRILFVSNGEIIEEGSHAELMAKKGAYYRMYQVQSYYYKEREAAGE